MKQISQVIVCKLSYCHWSFLFIFTQIIQFWIILSSFILNEWVFTSMGVNSQITYEALNFNGTSFTGSLLSCSSGCTGNYLGNMKDWCSYYKDFDTYSSKSICEMFTSLVYSGALYIVFQCLSILMSLLLFFSIIYNLKKEKYQWLGYCASVMNLIFIYIGTLIWFFLNDIGIKNNCKDFPQEGKKVKFCATKGPQLLIALLIISPAITLIYIIIMLKLNKRRNSVDTEVLEYKEVTILGNSVARLFGQTSSIEMQNEFNASLRSVGMQNSEENGQKNFFIKLNPIKCDTEKQDDDKPGECTDTNTAFNKDYE